MDKAGTLTNFLMLHLPKWTSTLIPGLKPFKTLHRTLPNRTGASDQGHIPDLENRVLSPIFLHINNCWTTWTQMATFCQQSQRDGLVHISQRQPCLSPISWELPCLRKQSVYKEKSSLLINRNFTSIAFNKLVCPFPSGHARPHPMSEML